MYSLLGVVRERAVEIWTIVGWCVSSVAGAALFVRPINATYTHYTGYLLNYSEQTGMRWHALNCGRAYIESLGHEDESSH